MTPKKKEVRIPQATKITTRFSCNRFFHITYKILLPFQVKAHTHTPIIPKVKINPIQTNDTIMSVMFHLHRKTVNNTLQASLFKSKNNSVIFPWIKKHISIYTLTTVLILPSMV